MSTFIDWFKNVRYLIYFAFYKGVAKNLPYSNSGVGKFLFAKRIRNGLTRRIIMDMGQKCNVEKGADFTRYTTLGDYSGLGINCSIAPYVYIGANVLMGPNVTILTLNHCHDRTDVPIKQQGYESIKPVTIRDDVWIGRNVIIMPGVTVNVGSIIGAGAVVTKDVPEYSIVGGVPAIVLKYRE